MTNPSAELRTITAEELAQWRQLHDDLTIIDVRSPAEFETLHIHGSYNVPLPLLTEHASELAERLGHRAVLVCQSGNRATQAQQHLAAAGVRTANVLTGGVPAFEAAGGQVVRGAARWDIERQVRFTAGLIVLVSLLVAEFLWPESRFIAFALSAGLVVAALTGSCLMGRILSRMPWNKVTASPTARSAIASIPVATQEL
ncbi:rhodanese-like domain-containing protein [Propionibacteriaceae bacterium Y2011]|uniref:rhodanese-like domain-containing protein n=1 Tax=Actinomycetes TaxID=1760 RepID=UPI000D8BD385|nr:MULTISPECIES: rhodanese-like domain-containing protein [Micrococcales]MCO7271868.1 rhodanese-like domain-containing protein [Cellulosimicrobium cellulans]PXY32870.1 sulfurtransferase [Prauserella coralliicola]QTV80892.1 rhodanese-like domain-containing protein [Microbacterium sp. NIBRBAC000506063]